MTVFAVPERPRKSVGRPNETWLSRSHSLRTVSSVGTMISAKRAFSGGAYSGTRDDHDAHRSSSGTKTYSYSDLLGSCAAGRKSPSCVPMPLSFLTKASKRSRSCTTVSCTTVAPIDQIVQKMKALSRMVGSAPAAAASASFFWSFSPASTRSAASMLHSCSIMLRLVSGSDVLGFLTIWSPSTPSSTKSTQGWAYLSNRPLRICASFSFCRVLSHRVTNGRQPRLRLSTYTMPHREMVAGDAYCRSNTSNRSLQWFTRRMRSPFGSVSSLLSSITLFMFSTQSASTSPSKTM